MYHIVDIKTGLVVGKRSTRNAASNRADKLDLAYGAVRYVVRWVA